MGFFGGNGGRISFMQKVKASAQSPKRRAGKGAMAGSVGNGGKCKIQLSPNPDYLDGNSKVDWLG